MGHGPDLTVPCQTPLQPSALLHHPDRSSQLRPSHRLLCALTGLPLQRQASLACLRGGLDLANLVLPTIPGGKCFTQVLLEFQGPHMGLEDPSLKHKDNEAEHDSAHLNPALKEQRQRQANLCGLEVSLVVGSRLAKAI